MGKVYESRKCDKIIKNIEYHNLYISIISYGFIKYILFNSIIFKS